MPFPIKLGANRDYTALTASLVQLADTALALDVRVRAIQHAYNAAVALDYEANGAPVGTGATYTQMMADLSTFLGSPAWVKMMTYVDQLRDIGR